MTATPFVGGQVTVSSTADSNGTGNQTVGAGNFQLLNASGSTIKITAISIAASDPIVVSALTLTGSSSSTSQTATVSNPGTSNNFPFTNFEIPAGGTGSCSLSATISSSTSSAASTSGSSPRRSATGAGGVAAVVLLLGALAWIRAPRRRLAAAMLLSAVWIGAYAGCGSNQSSAQTLMDVTASTDSGGPVTFSGIPASLGTVSRPEPLTLSGSGSSTSSSSTPRATVGPGTPTATPVPGTPTVTPTPTEEPF